MASLDGDEEEEEPAHPRQEEEQREEATQQQAAAMASFDDLSGPDDSVAASEAASVATSTTASMLDGDQSLQGMTDVLDDADYATTASSSAHSDMPAGHTLDMRTAGTAQQDLSTVTASEASPLVTNQYATTLSGGTSQTSAAANQAEAALSPELEIEAAESSPESSPRSRHLSAHQAAAQAASVKASAVSSGPGNQAEATSEALLEADDVQLDFESPDASPAMISAEKPLLQPGSVDMSPLPLLALNIGKKDSEDKEQQHLAPDLLAYAEAAMTEADAAADRHASGSSQATQQAGATHTALMTCAEAVLETAGHDQQADNIAAELFDELLTDAVQSMTTLGDFAHTPACFVPDAVNWADLLLRHMHTMTQVAFGDFSLPPPPAPPSPSAGPMQISPCMQFTGSLYASVIVLSHRHSCMWGL